MNTDAISSYVPHAYIETNIIRDLLERRHPYSAFLQEMAAGGDYRLITASIVIDETFLSLSREIRQELEELRVPIETLFETARKRMISFLNVTKIEGLHVFNLGLIDRIRSMVRAFNLARKFKLDAYDALHLELACSHKANYFVTRDKGMLKISDSFFEERMVRILRPEQLVPVIYERLEEVRGSPIEENPPCIEKVLDRIKAGTIKLSQAELILIANFHRRCLNRSSEEIHNMLKRMFGYDSKRTEAGLRKYHPLIWFCEDVKQQCPHICPYSAQREFCEHSPPFPQDIREDIRRVNLAKSRNSPFYYYIRKVSK